MIKYVKIVYYLLMKELTTYITEKLDISKVTLYNSDFPINGSIKDICEYLRHQGFIEIPNNGKLKLFLAMNDKKDKVFAWDAGLTGKFVRFADTSNHDIDKEHPSYVIFSDGRHYKEWIENNKTEADMIPKEKLLKMVKKQFKL